MSRSILTGSCIALVAFAVAAPAEPGEAPPDSAPPRDLPDEPGGVFGYSRYVFSEIGGEVVTTLVEGPPGRQVRCQDEELPCSYAALKALHESGREVPAELGMTREELGRLVSELDATAATLARYDSIDRACADGYYATSEQNPNMGIHMANFRHHSDGVFDPARPEMLLFAKPGGHKLGRDVLGQCRDGAWTGDKDFQIVGAAYMLPTEIHGEAHPEGFTGPIDNWHVHYHSCRGLRSDLILTEAECTSRGGQYVEKAGWMIHAYAAPEFDNPLGVFAMWNLSIWPRVEERGGAQPAAATPADAVHSSIERFAFTPIEVEAGAPVVITNGDAVPHTVTAGTPQQPDASFDSGALATGESFTLRLEEPGEYPFFCQNHPFMLGTVVVK